MRTIAIPAPITIPTIFTENKKEGTLTFHTQFHKFRFIHGNVQATLAILLKHQ